MLPHFTLYCVLLFECSYFALAFPINVFCSSSHGMRNRAKISSTVAETIFDFARSYESAAENAGLLTDVLTCGSINTASDTVAQFLTFKELKTENDEVKNNEQDSSRSDFPYDGARTLRLALFGLADGAVSHVWFLALDSVVGDGQGLFDTLVKTAADALVYTPLWCAWFLAFMTFIEPANNNLSGNNNGSIAARFQSVFVVWGSDWLELFRGNVGFFLPLTGLIYGYVPREERVLAFGLASLVYTTILSLWNQSRVTRDKAIPLMNMELCEVDDVDKECVPAPRPSRAILPFRLRRIVVKASRGFR